MAEPDETSDDQLAAQWKPYIETCIEAFGAERCMFESNFPVDRFGATYTALWNAFKRIAKDYSADEKTALFSGTAQARVPVERELEPSPSESASASDGRAGSGRRQPAVLPD